MLKGAAATVGGIAGLVSGTGMLAGARAYYQQTDDALSRIIRPENDSTEQQYKGMGPETIPSAATPKSASEVYDVGEELRKHYARVKQGEGRYDSSRSDSSLSGSEEPPQPEEPQPPPPPPAEEPPPPPPPPPPEAE